MCWLIFYIFLRKIAQRKALSLCWDGLVLIQKVQAEMTCILQKNRNGLHNVLIEDHQIRCVFDT